MWTVHENGNRNVCHSPLYTNQNLTDRILIIVIGIEENIMVAVLFALVNIIIIFFFSRLGILVKKVNVFGIQNPPNVWALDIPKRISCLEIKMKQFFYKHQA